MCPALGHLQSRADLPTGRPPTSLLWGSTSSSAWPHFFSSCSSSLSSTKRFTRGDEDFRYFKSFSTINKHGSAFSDGCEFRSWWLSFLIILTYLVAIPTAKKGRSVKQLTNSAVYISPYFSEKAQATGLRASLNKSQLLFRLSHSSNRFLLPFEKRPSQLF